MFDNGIESFKVGWCYIMCFLCFFYERRLFGFCIYDECCGIINMVRRCIVLFVLIFVFYMFCGFYNFFCVFVLGVG